MKPDAPPGTYGAFIMLPEGVGRLFAAGFNDGPFPEHYEAVEAPVENPLHPNVTSNPVSKQFSTRQGRLRHAEEFPIVCTTYRLTEHFHYWTQHHHGGLLNELQPGFFVEIPEGLARGEGDRQRLAGEGHLGARRDRGRRDGHEAAAPAQGRRQGRSWQIGFPIHWGFAGDPATPGRSPTC